MKKTLQVISESGKAMTFGAECIHSSHDGGYYAEAWDTSGKVVATTRIYKQPETCWKNLKSKLARKYGKD